MTTTLLAAIVMIVAIGMLVVGISSGKIAPSAGSSIKARNKPMLSPWERRILPKLVATAPQGSHVCPQVRLAEIIAHDRKDDPRLFGKIAQKSVDFVICDISTGKPLLVIELNDKSHDRPDRAERDRFVSELLKAASIPLLVMRPNDPAPNLGAVLRI